MPEYRLSFSVALTLLKIRLLLDLRTLRDTGAIGEKVPQEILDSIRGQLVSPVIASNTQLLNDIITGKRLDLYISDLESQVETLYGAVKAENKHFWPALLASGSHLPARPRFTSFGGESDMQMALQYNYRAWV